MSAVSLVRAYLKKGYRGEIAITVACGLFIASVYFMSNIRIAIDSSRTNSTISETPHASHADVKNVGKLPIILRAMPYSIDVVENGEKETTLPTRADMISLDAKKPVSIKGWTYDGDTAHVARAVFLVVDDGQRFAATYGDPRPDVAKVRGVSLAVDCGFAVTILSGKLSSGSHHIALDIVDSKGDAIYRQPDILTIVITS